MPTLQIPTLVIGGERRLRQITSAFPSDFGSELLRRQWDICREGLFIPDHAIIGLSMAASDFARILLPQILWTCILMTRRVGP